MVGGGATVAPAGSRLAISTGCWCRCCSCWKGGGESDVDRGEDNDVSPRLLRRRVTVASDVERLRIGSGEDAESAS
jgi:hypothetical protein